MEVSGGFITENYQQDSRDNLTTLFRLDLTLPREYSVFRRMQVAYQRLYNDYRRSTFFDHNEHRLEINGYQPLTRRLTVLPSVTVGLRQFDRVAVARVRNAGFIAVQAMDPQQADFFAEPAIRLQYFRRILLEGSYMYRVFRSNSYGFSFREHRIGMIVGSRFFFNSTLKILADLAAKQYRERGPNILTDLDEDREADNRGVIELSRAVTQQAAIEMRYEFYRNESRVRRLYYSKSVVSVGLQYRL